MRNIAYYAQKIATPPFHVAVYRNRLLNYSFQYEQYSIANTLNAVLSGIKHEESQDANDLIVQKLSFLILLYFLVSFEISIIFINLIYFVIMFMSYVHKKSASPKAIFFLCCLEGSEILDNSSKLFWSVTSGFTTLTSVFGNLLFSLAEIESSHCRQIVDGRFLVKKFLDNRG